VDQDHLRRILLWEHDKPGGLAPALIAHTVRFVLDNGRDVVLEGILHTARYHDVLARLWRAHRSRTHFYYLNVSLEETLRRHTTRPQATQFSGEDMRRWYQAGDTLGFDSEHVIPQTSTLEESITYIATTAGLTLTPAAGVAQTPTEPEQVVTAPGQRQPAGP
jgi:hypothetical protein